MRVPDGFLIAGRMYQVTVTAVKPNGIIVLIDGTEYTAHIHISNLSSAYVTDASRIAELGQQFTVKAVPWHGIVELSLKDAAHDPKPNHARKNSTESSEDLERMIARCEAVYRDKTRGHTPPTAAPGRRRSPKRCTFNESDD